MLSELLLFAVVGFLALLVGIFSFKLGMQYGVNVFLAGYEAKTGKKVAVNEVNPPKKPRKTKKEETSDQRKRNILMSNINAFDGSEMGQMEIK